MDNPTRLLLERAVFKLECANLLSNDNIIEADNNATTTCFAFSSGMQAVTSILLAHSSPKTTVLIPTDVYHGVRSLLSDVLSRHGVKVRELNMTTSNGDGGGEKAIGDAISEIATAMDISKKDNNNDDNNNDDLHNIIVWMETPSNPKCEVVDIKAVCDTVRDIAGRWKHVVDVTTVVDGTMASPVLTRPLEVCCVII